MMNYAKIVCELNANNELYMDVKSSAIQTIALHLYGDDTIELNICFTGERWYGYTVPMGVIKAMTEAESLGRWYGHYIRGKFRSVRL